MNKIDNIIINDLIKNKKYDILYNHIKSGEIVNFINITSKYNINFINYIVMDNRVDIMNLLLNLLNKKSILINIDETDVSGRTILHNCIIFDNMEMLRLLLHENNINMLSPLFDILDIIGYTCLHYTVYLNNFNAFVFLIDIGFNPYIESNDNFNIFHIAICKENDEVLHFLLDNNFSIDFKYKPNNKNLLQFSNKYYNFNIVKKIIDKTTDINNIETIYNSSILLDSVLDDCMDKYKYIIKRKDIDIYVIDKYGSNILHIVANNNNIEYLNILYDNIDINIYNFDLLNQNGHIPLSILLNNINIYVINIDIINIFILKSDLNIPDHYNQTCYMKLCNVDIFNSIYEILKYKKLNMFINKNFYDMHMKVSKYSDLILISYYNQLKDIDDKKLNKIEINSKYNFNKHKKQLLKFIIKNKKSYKNDSDLSISFDKSKSYGLYTGFEFDYLMGLLLIYKLHKKNGLDIIINKDILETYTNIRYIMSNHHIIWNSEKVTYPFYFEETILKKLKTSKYLAIPIGMCTKDNRNHHANIIFWDIKKKTIERFEPHGSGKSAYDTHLLDDLLETKFKTYDKDILYYRPKDFLQVVGFQYVENIENILFPISNDIGYCVAWGYWWVSQRMYNINKNIDIPNIALELMKKIKTENNLFTNIIIQFADKIINEREKLLKNVNLSIHDIQTHTITDKDIYKINKYINDYMSS